MAAASRRQALAWSTLLACVTVVPGALVLYDPVDIPWPDRLELSLLLLFPGIVPALLLGDFGVLGNMHDPSPTVTVLLSFASWLFLFYKLICKYQHRRREQKRV